jgi:type 1 glutamine amidotransferase
LPTVTARIPFLLLLVAATWATAVPAGEPVRVMILDGESSAYHDWKASTPLLRRMLADARLFEVDVVTAPPAGADFAAFQPDFKRYHAIVLNYDAPDGRWPATLRQSLEQYIRQGGGLVIVHAANNAFPGWPAFNEMAGIGGWRGRDEAAGPYWFLREGRLVSDTAPGVAGSHGRRLPFQITVRAEHPITAGLPQVWMHAGDELYAHLRGPGRNMTVLATAWSDPANAGSGRDEPQLIVLRYGNGRIFHTTLGHDLPALGAVDFIVTFQRGTEWAATGGVTQAVPADFPGPDAARQRWSP